MGASFYLMIALCIIIYRIAEAERRRGWLWFAINFCVSMLVGKFFGLTAALVILSGFLTFILMFAANILSPTKKMH